MPMWRNRQTRYVQGVVGVTPWEFESPPRHRATFVTLEIRARARSHAKTLTAESEDGRWAPGIRGKSELHRARVPGESRGNAFAR